MTGEGGWKEDKASEIPALKQAWQIGFCDEVSGVIKSDEVNVMWEAFH